MLANTKDEPRQKLVKTIYVFGYDLYYPRGGIRDLKGRFGTLAAAHDFLVAESAKKGGIVAGWEELEVLKITEQDIKIITTGKTVGEYLRWQSEEEEASQDKDEEAIKRREWLEEYTINSTKGFVGSKNWPKGC